MLVANLDHHHTNEKSMVQPAEEVNPHMTLVGFRSTPGEIPDLAYFSWATSVACANAWDTTHWIPRAPTRRRGEWTCRFGPYNFTEVSRTAQLGCAVIGIISSIVVSGGHLTPEPSPASALSVDGNYCFLSTSAPMRCFAVPGPSWIQRQIYSLLRRNGFFLDDLGLQEPLDDLADWFFRFFPLPLRLGGVPWQFQHSQSEQSQSLDSESEQLSEYEEELLLLSE
ncbi:hypothetical protein WN48_07684 [Eufriesea mexicana]|uniref:Uncharacterized protein n=1 Tax=Eufriesea mexicana TaxID=516756 RepID=A0A310SQS7_9HYME|nr:hypothetical protein WN48_07684 [Eufriesea mexicana]